MVGFFRGNSRFWFPGGDVPYQARWYLKLRAIGHIFSTGVTKPETWFLSRSYCIISRIDQKPLGNDDKLEKSTIFWGGRQFGANPWEMQVEMATQFGMGATAMGILAGIVGGLTSYLLVTLMRGASTVRWFTVLWRFGWEETNRFGCASKFWESEIRVFIWSYMCTCFWDCFWSFLDMFLIS